MRREKGGLFFNMMKKRYFKNSRAIARAKDSMRVDLGGQLSPYDDLAKKYALRYGQDWRMLTAQMYQESKFDPARRELGRGPGTDADHAEDG